MSYTRQALLEDLSANRLIEGDAVEFKEKWAREHGKSLSAFGNSKNGGWLLVGVDNSGQCLNKDMEWMKKQREQIERHIDQYLNPASAVQSISPESANGKNFLLIEAVNPGAIVSWNRGFYRRSGSSSQKMSPGERKSLELKRPGSDFSEFKYDKGIDPVLVLDFAKFLTNSAAQWTKLSANDVLLKLKIKNKNAAGILFGGFSFRVARYNEKSEVLDQKEKKGLYHLLKGEFIQNIQSWTRSKPLALRPGALSVMEEEPYPKAVLREILVNAVAHSAFERQGRGAEVKLYKNRITVSNQCSAQAAAFINKRFSDEHFSHNPLLIKLLRKAGFSDELGTGKSRIFKAVIESGKREPLFEYQRISEDYGVWTVTLYNEQPNKSFLRLLEKIKGIYKNNEDKYKISAAMVLWRDKPLKEIFSYMDEYHKKLAEEILADESSPFLPVFGAKAMPEAKILLKRWAKVQLEGRESKTFSKSEENKFKEALRIFAYKDSRGGHITNKEARRLFGLSDSQSEIVQLSKIFQLWEKEGFMERTKRRGCWKIAQKPA